MLNTAMIRSVLFVPGNQPDRIDKAAKSAADAVIVDLEDAVPMDEKQAARRFVAEALHRHGDRKLWVRVNGPDTDWIQADIEAAITAGIGGIMVPKLEMPEQVAQIVASIAHQADKNAIDPEELFFVPLVETALSVENAYRLALSAFERSSNAILAFGAADFTTDLGINMTTMGTELHYPRARIAVASRAAGIQRPLDTPYMIDIKDREGLKNDALRARDLGFQGKLCVHPLQVEVVNDVFTPSQAEIDFARRALTAFEAAEKAGKGAVQLDGKFIDPPIVERARQIIAWERR